MENRIATWQKTRHTSYEQLWRKKILSAFFFSLLASLFKYKMSQNLSSSGFRVHLWAVPVWNATRRQPHRLRPHSHHQAGVALPLGRGSRFSLHAGNHRHLLRHRHLRALQRHPYCASVGPGDELRAPDGDLPLLRHHLPDDLYARRGSVFLQEDFPGLRDVFQLRRSAHKD